jgi:hypothetical protein
MSNPHAYIAHAREEQQQYIHELMHENEQLRARCDEVTGENERFAERYRHIEEQSNNLANLYVASYQLHTSVDRHAVLTAIHEIVINLIGSEQLAIYERIGDAGFGLATAFGLEEERLLPVIGGEYAVEKLGEGHIFRDYTEREPLTASIPLRIGGRVIGAILVFRLLEHKFTLEHLDHELFDLLAIHAATALYCASMHARRAN